MLRGHIKLDAGTTLQSVICSGCCILCGMEHECTIEQVLDQPTYGGNDYEDGGTWSNPNPNPNPDPNPNPTPNPNQDGARHMPNPNPNPNQGGARPRWRRRRE